MSIWDIEFNKEEYLLRERAIAFIDGYIHGVKIEIVRRAVIALLEEMGELPEELEIRIREEKDLIILKIWLVLAKKAKDLEEFCREIDK